MIGSRPRGSVDEGVPASRPVAVGPATELLNNAIAVAVGLVLLNPLIAIVTTGSTLTGMTEESTGYRYFYTLRMLYGQHERPWLPQGQFVGLFHMGLQVALTALGYPATQLTPRIDLWAYLAAGLPVVVSIPLLVWATRPFRHPVATLAVGGALVAVTFQARTSAGYHLLQPDYYAWILPTSLVCLGWLLRLAADDARARARDVVIIGVLGGACLATKLTYLIFTLPVILLLAYRLHSAFARALALIVTPIFIAVFGVVFTLLYYLGDVDATKNYFARLAVFVEGVDAVQPFGEWVWSVVFGAPLDAITLMVALPVVLLISIILIPRRPVTIALLPSSLAAVYIAYRRYYPPTLIETDGLLFSTGCAWLAGVGFPFAIGLLKTRLDLQRARLPVAHVTTILVLGWSAMIGKQALDAGSNQVRVFQAATLAANALHDYLGHVPGRTAFLIPENSYRPLSVDSAIFKGGSDPAVMTWGVSPLVAAMFPDRQYFLGGTPSATPPVDLGPFDKLVYTSIPSFGGDADIARQLRVRFGISTEAFDCSFRAPAPEASQIFVACRRVSPS